MSWVRIPSLAPFDSGIRRFESSRPSQNAWTEPRPSRLNCGCCVRNEWDTLALRYARQQLFDAIVEMLRLLVRIPSRGVDVQLEDEERRRRGRRAIGQEQLNPRLCHRRRDQTCQERGDSFGLARFRLDMNRDYEPVIEIVPSETARAHLNL